MPKAIVVMLALLAAACAPSQVRVERAKASRYMAEYPQVWRAVATVLIDKYGGLRRANPVTGEIWTEWGVLRSIEANLERLNGSDGEGREEKVRHQRYPHEEGRLAWRMPGGGGNAKLKPLVHPRQKTKAPGTTADLPSYDTVQLRIRIVGTRPPYQVVIDGEGALLYPGHDRLVPVPGRPDWVGDRIDEVYLAVYDELRTAAILPPRRTEATARAD